MNIFLPYEKSIELSVASLDDARLNKQILETKILTDGARAYEKGEVPNSYFKHPVAQFYKNDIGFLCYYGFQCCKEYWFRFNKYHQYYDFFENLCENYYKINEAPAYEPYYMEKSKNSPDRIRTTEFVSELFKAKLIMKWLADKRKPQWTLRGSPKFYNDYLSLSEKEQYEYWEITEIIKEGVRPA